MLIKNIRLYTGKEYFSDGCVLINGSTVEYAGSVNGIAFTDDKEVIDGKNGICMPGLCNCHTHSPMGLMRGIGSDLKLMDWLDLIMAIEDKITPELMYRGAMLGIMEMLSSGTTSFADMYMLMDEVIRAVNDSGIRANLTRGSNSKEGIDSHNEWYKKYNGGRIRIYIGLHAEYTSNSETAMYAADTAKKLGTGVHIHVSETKGEVADCIKRHGKTPVRYFYDMGMLENPAILAHCVHLTEEDMDIIAETGATAAHCPASNLKLASGIADIAGLRKKGCRVALGTDGAASNNALDMFREMRMLSLLAKGVTGDATAMTARETITVATKNGATAMGFDDVGTLEKGMKADLVILSADDINLLPGNDPIADIVYSANGGNVRMTMVDGKILYRDGIFTTIDSEKIISEIKSMYNKEILI